MCGTPQSPGLHSRLYRAAMPRPNKGDTFWRDELGVWRQRYRDADWEPTKLVEHLQGIGSQSGCEWSKTFDVLVSTKPPSQGVCMLKCKGCKVELRPSNISATHTAHIDRGWTPKQV